MSQLKNKETKITIFFLKKSKRMKVTFLPTK